jgi:hypothetical protein
MPTSVALQYLDVLVQRSVSIKDLPLTPRWRLGGSEFLLARHFVVGTRCFKNFCLPNVAFLWRKFMTASLGSAAGRSK